MRRDYLVECFNEMHDTNYTTFEELRNNESKKEIFEAYLSYEGICGYANAILEVLDTLGMLS